MIVDIGTVNIKNIKMKENKLTEINEGEMKIGKKIKIQKGHLWEKDSGSCINWTGYSGQFICKRCLSTMEATKQSSNEPYTHEWMIDVHGKKVKRKDWHICIADK